MIYGLTMNPEEKAKWVADLRSGLKQCHGYLKTTDGMCCLGVYAEGKKVKSSVDAPDVDKENVFTFFFDGAPDYGEIEARHQLPASWFGQFFTYYDKSLDTGDHRHTMMGAVNTLQGVLTKKNDGEKGDTAGEYVTEPQTFSEIADWIEANL